jgi:hypothetical protein
VSSTAAAQASSAVSMARMSIGLPIAFSSEVDTGSRQEKRVKAGIESPVLIQSEPKKGARDSQTDWKISFYGFAPVPTFRKHFRRPGSAAKPRSRFPKPDRQMQLVGCQVIENKGN